MNKVTLDEYEAERIEGEKMTISAMLCIGHVLITIIAVLGVSMSFANAQDASFGVGASGNIVAIVAQDIFMYGAGFGFVSAGYSLLICRLATVSLTPIESE